MNANSQRPRPRSCPSSAIAAKAARDVAPAREERLTFATVECGSGWYHDAAIQAEIARKP